MELNGIKSIKSGTENGPEGLFLGGRDVCILLPTPLVRVLLNFATSGPAVGAVTYIWCRTLIQKESSSFQLSPKRTPVGDATRRRSENVLD